MDTGQQFGIGAALGNGQHIENWGDSATAADTSQQTETSTDVDTDDKNQVCSSFTLSLVEWVIFSLLVDQLRIEHC